MPDSHPSGPVTRPRLPPRWVIRTAWKVHRALYRFTPGSVGLSKPRPGGYGLMRVTTIGRRSGEERSVILGYLEDGPDLVTMAMNGWGEGVSAWWLNLQAQPEATVQLKDGVRRVTRRSVSVGD
ncbi:nitroreductase/quinone reductase family protein [Ornithinimicrobium cavernae]|uniref:nitroreductase/quinone reductase family protein n=1 Tax=Ornithinimicrobium cavernae TaxID=2666047 RepID=UPI000D69608F|nr:nitroreductase/quinone reductase family protein [Ornithinimicrobium cavernae]